MSRGATAKKPTKAGDRKASAAEREEEPMSIPYQSDLVLQRLRQLYHTFVEPLENRFLYEQFAPSHFGDTLITPRPFVLFLGPFSAGKSTFINYLLGQDLLYTGPEPTTNKFTVVMWGEEVNHVTGRILAASKDQPFKGLASFGSEFLESFAGVQYPSPLLQHVTLVDTPGVLETADVHSRSYDYIQVTKWFVQRADLVFILFDPAKLDAGRELRELFKQLHGNESKVRIILNKADSVDDQELMRVYGSVFWNLSNLVRTTEPPRVYVSSFWLRPYRPDTNHRLFDKERQDLLHDLMVTIPLQSLDHRVTAVLRRAADVMIHCYIIGTARERLPKWFGKRDAKIKTLDNLGEVYDQVSLKYRLPRVNFPPEDQYRKFFTKVDLYEMPSIADREVQLTLERLSRVMEQDIPALLKPIADIRTAAIPQGRTNPALARQHNAPTPLEAPAGIFKPPPDLPPPIPTAPSPAPQPPAGAAPPPAGPMAAPAMATPPSFTGFAGMPPAGTTAAPVTGVPAASPLQRQMQAYLQQQAAQLQAQQAQLQPLGASAAYDPQQQQALLQLLQQQQMMGGFGGFGMGMGMGMGVGFAGQQADSGVRSRSAEGTEPSGSSGVSPGPTSPITAANRSRTVPNLAAVARPPPPLQNPR